MNAQKLIEIASKLVSDDKGLLAMDESNATCDKRFAAAGIPQTLEARRAYRELSVTTPGLGACISGAILYDETIRQQKRDGTPFVKVLADAGVIPGIKVDIGAKDLAGHPGEKVTEGLDGLRDRLKEYLQMGARFAKWRAVIALGERIPSGGCIAGQRASVGPLCRSVPGDRTGSRRRAGSAHGRRPYVGALPRGHGGGPAKGLRPAFHAKGDAGGNDPEAQHGASRLELRQAGDGGRGGRRNGEKSASRRPRRRSGDRFSVRRPIWRIGLRPFERDERPVQGGGVATALGLGVFVRARHSAARLGDMERRADKSSGGSEGSLSSSRLQPGRAPWRIQRRDGSGVSGGAHDMAKAK